MTVDAHARPPITGDWEQATVPRTGAWAIGPLWADWSQAHYCLQVRAEHCNGMGMMHGGAMATFLDGQVFILKPDQMARAHTPTITLSVDFLAPPQEGDWLVAEVQHVKTTRSMIVTQALAKVGDRVVARSSAIYSNTQGKDAA